MTESQREILIVTGLNLAEYIKDSVVHALDNEVTEITVVQLPGLLDLVHVEEIVEFLYKHVTNAIERYVENNEEELLEAFLERNAPEEGED